MRRQLATDSRRSKPGKHRIGPAYFPLCGDRAYAYIRPVNRLTRQEQIVLCSVLGLLLVGLAVKTYRSAHLREATTPRVLDTNSTSAANEPI
jgi:hypothetical protein